MMEKIVFKKEFNTVVAYRSNGRVSHLLLPDQGASVDEIQRVLQWAYELGRRDRHLESQKFCQGLGTLPIIERL